MGLDREAEIFVDFRNRCRKTSSLAKDPSKTLTSLVQEDFMETHCVLCGTKIDNVEQYLRNKANLVQTRRYQEIIDILLDSSKSYDYVLFDHTHELPSPYREIAFRNTSALQEQPGKASFLHKKEADITAVRGNFCDIIIEEELKPSPDQVQQDISRITPCSFLWTRGRQFELRDAYLFVVIKDNANGISESIREGTGCFKRVIVCETHDFKRLFESYYLQRR